KVDVYLFCFSCTGTTPSLTVALRATSGGLPTGGDLATASIPGFAGSPALSTAVFSSPPMLTAGTQYALVIHPDADPSAGGLYAWRNSNGDAYAGGTLVGSVNSGGTWVSNLADDVGFKAYLLVFAPSGNLVSSAKGANPGAGSSPTWGTLSFSESNPPS